MTDLSPIEKDAVAMATENFVTLAESRPSDGARSSVRSYVLTPEQIIDAVVGPQDKRKRCGTLTKRSSRARQRAHQLLSMVSANGEAIRRAWKESARERRRRAA